MPPSVLGRENPMSDKCQAVLSNPFYLVKAVESRKHQSDKPFFLKSPYHVLDGLISAVFSETVQLRIARLDLWRLHGH